MAGQEALSVFVHGMWTSARTLLRRIQLGSWFGYRVDCAWIYFDLRRAFGLFLALWPNVIVVIHFYLT